MESVKKDIKKEVDEGIDKRIEAEIQAEEDLENEIMEQEVAELEDPEGPEAEMAYGGGFGLGGVRGFGRRGFGYGFRRFSYPITRGDFRRARIRRNVVPKIYG